MTGTTHAVEADSDTGSVTERTVAVTEAVSLHLYENGVGRTEVSLTDLDTLRTETLYEGYDEAEAESVFNRMEAGELACKRRIRETFPEIEFPSDDDDGTGADDDSEDIQ